MVSKDISSDGNGASSSRQRSEPLTCAIIVVNYCTPDHAVTCIRSVAAQSDPDKGWHIVLVDNASPDDSAEKLPRALADLIDAGFVTFLPLAHNGGFAWGNNQALLHLHDMGRKFEFAMLLNPDCVLELGAIDALIADMHDYPECAVNGSLLLNTDGSVTGCCFNFVTLGNEMIRALRLPGLGRMLGIAPVQIPPGTEREVGWVSGAACLIRTAALEQVGLMDDGFFLYFEEVELMHRIHRAGWTIRHVPSSRVVHIGGASTGLLEGHARQSDALPDYWHESRRRYFSLIYGRILGRWATPIWLTGDSIARVIGFFCHSRSLDTRADRAKMIAIGLQRKPHDHKPARICFGDGGGAPPTWMSFS